MTGRPSVHGSLDVHAFYPGPTRPPPLRLQLMVVRGPLLAASPLSPTLLQQRHILAFACAAGPVAPPSGSPASYDPPPSPARLPSCEHN